MTDRLLSLGEAEMLTGCTRSYLLNQARSGRLGYVMTSPHKRTFPESALRAWMATWKRVPAVAMSKEQE